VTEFICHTVSWSTAAEPLCEIRRQVFIKEQNVPPELEWEDADKHADHFLLTQAPSALDSAMGCARVLREDHTGTARFHIGRVAILSHVRQRGAGTYLMRELLHWCQQQSDYTHCQQVFLHAQCDVIPFYERLGFNAVGTIFVDAGIAHRTMIWQNHD